ncbi:MAG: polymerase, sigma-24 subunit, subfamily [Akkermansiaceae bacterium]|nr:polymerase, sigma-24 subunit, subfamily [Akkermansiaceae bacterium]
MTAFAHTPDSGDDFPLLGKWSRSTSRSQSSDPSLASTAAEIAAPDPADFTAQWARAQLSVRAYLNSFLSDRSSIDDCIQEVALLAWKKGPRDSPGDAFLGFTLACAKRIAMSEVRKKYRTRLRLLSPDVVASLSDAVAAQELAEPATPAMRISALQSCLDSLEAAPRRLLDLRYSSKDPTALQQEARATGKSIDALYKKLERLRVLLRDCVAGKSTSRE